MSYLTATIYEWYGKLCVSYDYIADIDDKILYLIKVINNDQNTDFYVFKDNILIIRTISDDGYRLMLDILIDTSIEIKNINANNAFNVVKTAVINDEFKSQPSKLEEVVMILDEFVNHKQRLLNEINMFYDNLGNRKFFVSPKGV